jgi:hypothetical protein
VGGCARARQVARACEGLCVKHCVYCYDNVQVFYVSGSTLLGNYEDNKKVGPHVYMDKGMFVFVHVFLYVYVCMCLSVFVLGCVFMN